MLLGVHGVSKSFGADVILEGVSFRIDPRQKVALVGRNGTGKTTLLRIITGEYEPDTGSVQLTRGAQIGYLKQEQSVTGTRTVLQEAQASQAHEIELKNRLEMLEKRIAEEATPQDLEEYALVHEHFLEAEGYSLEHDARTVLARMGFTEDEYDKPTNVLSGGEKTRLALARLLLEEPELLILDEPTNHLDLEATEWLEGWINAYHGAVLLVSHDRVFLENTAQSFLDLRDHTVKAFPGPFDHYMKVKAEDDARRDALATKQEAEIAKLDEFVRRFMNSQRTAQARGRQKHMNRLIESKVERTGAEKGMAAGFGKTTRSGDLVVECKGLVCGFEEPLFPALDWTVRWGDRWGVIGENGAGKSTLIKTILGEIPAISGMFKIGSNVTCGLFRQDVTDLDPEDTPLSVMVYDAGMDTAPARDFLGRFLFSGDDVMRPIKTLSGGEKNKLELARLTQASPNLLVLDEPTNHLDMDSREALARVINEFKGTLILVSHDRWLLGQVTDSLLDIRKSGAVVFPGGYSDYRSRNMAIAVPSKTAHMQQEARNQAPAISPRELSKEIQRLEKLVAELENEVAEAEARQRTIEKLLADLSPTADVLELTRSHSSIVEQVAASLSAWEEQTLRLEELKVRQGPAGHEPGVTFRPK